MIKKKKRLKSMKKLKIATKRAGIPLSSDYHVTPEDSIQSFLEAFNVDFSSLRILDPCAGGILDEGEVSVEMPYPTVLKAMYGDDIDIDTLDIRTDSLAKIKEDYFAYAPEEKYDVVISTPPADLAIHFIKKGLQDVKVGGYVIMMVRLNFFGSAKRKPFFEKFMPVYTFVHHNRIAFYKGKSADKMEHMHLVFQKGKESTEFTQLKVI